MDENQAEIVDALRRCGASVVSLAPVGHGIPDLLVGYRGSNYLLECKDGGKTPSRRKQTPDQLGFHADWQGQAEVVNSVDEALKVIDV